MKRIVLAGLGLALLTGGALAQSATPAAPAALPPPASATAKAPPPPPPAEAMMDDAGPAMPPPPPGGPHGHRPPPPSKAAHFRVEHGDTAVDVKCADDEPMKACADIALQLLDRVGGTQPKP